MPGFVAPIKNSGSSQPEKVSSESGGNETFSSIILGNATKNVEKKTNPFESCLQTLKKVSTSEVDNLGVKFYEDSSSSLAVSVSNNEISRSQNTELEVEGRELQMSDTQRETELNATESQGVTKETRQSEINDTNNKNTTETCSNEIAETSEKLNKKSVNKTKDNASKQAKSEKNKKSMKKENDVNVNNTKDVKINNKKTKLQKERVTNKNGSNKKKLSKTATSVNDKVAQNKNLTQKQVESASQNMVDMINPSQEISCSQASNFSSVFSKMVLSQAPKNYTHKQRMEWLQERRQVGLWVQCSKPDCLKWRYLSHIHDPTSLPEVWYCYMNPDGRANECNKKERKIKLREEEDCIHAQYSAGSLVWGHLQGYPWWPAVVDDDPDTEQFYWLDGFSDIPTYYHVTFFDRESVTRTWLPPNRIQPFVVSGHYNKIKNIKVNPIFTNRLKYAIEQAKEAIDHTILERLKKYSFIALYKGPINSPKPEKLLKKSQKRCVDVSSESDSSDSEDTESQLLISKKKTKRNKCSIVKMLETELSNSTMVSLEDLIMYNRTGDNQSEVDSTSSSRNSETSAEIPIQPIIRVQSTGLKILQQIIPETEDGSSIIESTVNQNTQDTMIEFDAVVPSTQIDVQNITENSTQNTITFNSY